MQINKTYEAKQIEAKWYRHWEENNYFEPREDNGQPPFTILIPPPNVTGILHMGHVLNNTLQDVAIRFHRMLGRPTLWLPGVDHAGIATQNMVEKSIAKDGLTRHDVGREKLVEMIWQWKEEKGNIIIDQLKLLGASCDWKRQRFTMDEMLSRAVKEVFVRLYNEGLIYKGKYIINWCPRCVTALANDEVEHEDSKGKLWHIRYPLQRWQRTHHRGDHPTGNDVGRHRGSHQPQGYPLYASGGQNAEAAAHRQGNPYHCRRVCG